MGKLKKVFPVAVLVVLCGLIFFSRLHTYDEPLDRDLTTYAVIAHEMLSGKALYSDLWDHKPPAIHVTYAAAELIAGYGRDSIFLMNITAAVATLLACYWAGSAAGGGRTGGCFAAAFWALASGNLAIEGNQPNTEVFLNACLATAFAILVRKRNLGTWAAVLVGLLFAAASLYKQVVLVQAALLLGAYCLCCESTSRKRAIIDAMIIAAIGAAMWGLVFAYFFMRGSGPAFTEAVFTYNNYYAKSGWNYTVSNFQGWPTVSHDVLAIALSMMVLVIAGLVHGLTFGPRRHWTLLLAFLASTGIAVLLPGWFYWHYHQLWLPPLAIGSGWAIALFRRLLPTTLSALSYSVGGVACAVVVMAQVPDYLAPAEAWSYNKYGIIFLGTDQFAYRLNRLLPPGATFYEWGSETELYFSSQRRPASGILFAYPMLSGPLMDKLSQRLISDLEKSRPDLIIVGKNTLAETNPGHPVIHWFKENYRPFSETDLFILLARKGGTLEAASTSHSTWRASSSTSF
ncbi:MAG: hypothetical protein ABI925_02110 [Verrucomicrobiota bacterium]